MDSSPNNRKILIISGAGVLVLILIVVIASSAFRRPTTSTTPNPSASTASSPSATGTTTTPETTYRGTDTFFTYGLSKSQFESLKFALHQFFVTKNTSPTVIEFKQIKHIPNRHTGINTWTFNFTVDQKTTYQNHMTIVDLNSIDLRISQDGKEIYHSGPVKMESPLN